MSQRVRVNEAFERLAVALAPVVEGQLQERFGTDWRLLVGTGPGVEGRWTAAALLQTGLDHWGLLGPCLQLKKSALQQLLQQSRAVGEPTAAETAATLQLIEALRVGIGAPPTAASPAACVPVGAGRLHGAAGPVLEERPAVTVNGPAPGAIPAPVAPVPRGSAGDGPPAPGAAPPRAAAAPSPSAVAPSPAAVAPASGDPRLVTALLWLNQGLGAFVTHARPELAVPAGGDPAVTAARLLDTIIHAWWELGDGLAPVRGEIVALHRALPGDGSRAAVDPETLLAQIEAVLSCVAPLEAEEVARLRGRSRAMPAAPRPQAPGPAPGAFGGSASPGNAPVGPVGAVAAVPGAGAEPLYYSVSSFKLVVMSIVTFGLYDVFWFYQQWKAVEKRTGERVIPLLRAFFLLWFCQLLFRDIRDTALSHGVKPRFSYRGALCGFIGLSACWGLPDPFWLLSGLAIFALVGVNNTCLAVNRHVAPQHPVHRRFSGWNVLVILVGGLWVIATGYDALQALARL